MMITPLSAPAAPARDPGGSTGDGFEQAMAAALGLVPIPAPTAIPTLDGGVVEAGSGAHPVAPAGLPAESDLLQVVGPPGAGVRPDLPTIDQPDARPDPATLPAGRPALPGQASAAKQIVAPPPGIAGGEPAAPESVDPVAGPDSASVTAVPPVTAYLRPDVANPPAAPQGPEVAAAVVHQTRLPAAAPGFRPATATGTTGVVTPAAVRRPDPGPTPATDPGFAHQPNLDAVAPVADPADGRPPTRAEEPVRPAPPTSPAFEAVHSAEGVPSVGDVTTTSTGEAPPVPGGLLHRVEEVIRRLENAPPPRSITLTIDDEGLTRITVSMLADGVRLSVPEGAQTPVRLVTDLEQALSSRGFDLSHPRDRGGRQRPHDADGFRPDTPTRRRGAETGVRL